MQTFKEWLLILEQNLSRRQALGAIGGSVLGALGAKADDGTAKEISDPDEKMWKYIVHNGADWDHHSAKDIIDHLQDMKKQKIVEGIWLARISLLRKSDQMSKLRAYTFYKNPLIKKYIKDIIHAETPGTVRFENGEFIETPVDPNLLKSLIK